MTKAECLEILRAVKSTSTDVCDENGQRLPKLESAIETAAGIIAELAEVEEAISDKGVSIFAFNTPEGRWGAYERKRIMRPEYAPTLTAAILAAIKGAGEEGQG